MHQGRRKATVCIAFRKSINHKLKAAHGKRLKLLDSCIKGGWRYVMHTNCCMVTIIITGSSARTICPCDVRAAINVKIPRKLHSMLKVHRIASRHIIHACNSHAFVSTHPRHGAAPRIPSCVIYCVENCE